MPERHRFDHKADNRNAGVSRVALSRDELGRLKSDCAVLISLADGLEAIADAIRTNRCADQAHHLVTCLRSHVSDHLAAEAAALDSVGAVEDAVLAAAIQRVQAEHAATRRLTLPVVRGLRLIRRDRLPERPAEFVIKTIVLCEFLRLHVRFKLETLYPLLVRLKLGEMEDGEGRGSGNGTRRSLETAEANGNARTAKTTKDGAPACSRAREK